jgi:hypothetical protein
MTVEFGVYLQDAHAVVGVRGEFDATSSADAMSAIAALTASGSDRGTVGG